MTAGGFVLCKLAGKTMTKRMYTANAVKSRIAKQSEMSVWLIRKSMRFSVF